MGKRFFVCPPISPLIRVLDGKPHDLVKFLLLHVARIGRRICMAYTIPIGSAIGIAASCLAIAVIVTTGN